MAADYDFRRKPNEKGDEELQPLYPRIVSKGTIDCKRLFREISEASTFNEGDLAGIMVSLQEKVSYYLSEGYHVKLGEIGYFSASLKARPATHNLCGLCLFRSSHQRTLHRFIKLSVTHLHHFLNIAYLQIQQTKEGKPHNNT